MKINSLAVTAICCKAWGIPPHEFQRLQDERKITFAQVMAQFKLELMNNPFSAREIQEFVFPGKKRDERKKQHQDETTKALAAFKRMRERQRNEQ